MASGVILATVEELAPIVIKTLAPEIQAALAALPTGTVKVVPPQIDVEVAVGNVLADAMPAFGAAIYKTIREKIGVAVAIYATGHPGDDLQGDAAWEDIQSMSLAAIAEEGLDAFMIPIAVVRQIVASGIVIHMAGLGTKALTVGK
jgi:hypothetical protein